MKILPFVVLQLIMLMLHFKTSISGRIIQCDPPELINAYEFCTTNRMANGKYINLTSCTVFCKEDYVHSSGPKAIDCYRGNWLHAGVGHVLYKEPTTCRPKPTPGAVFGRRANRPQFGPVQKMHDGMCSNNYCKRRYLGIPKSVCMQFKCCWNQEKHDCFEYLPEQCQIRMSERSPCPGTWRGIPEKKCTSRGCCFNDAKSECYTKKVSVKGTVVTSPETTEISTTNKPYNRCQVPDSKKQRCPKTWNGITKSACLSKKCCYDDAKHKCYSALEREDKSVKPTGRKPESTGVVLDRCAVPNAKRTTCPKTWRGIPKPPCRSLGCCYDDATHQCYSASQSTSDPGKTSPVAKSGCEKMEDISNGKLSCERTGDMLVCTAACDDRYMQTGVRQRTCFLSSGEWSPGEWNCQAEFCDIFELAPGTFADCTNGNRVGSICSASCAVGYELQDQTDFDATCLQNGEWSKPTAWQCKEIQCPKLDVSKIIDGKPGSYDGSPPTIICTKERKYGSVCAVSCPIGYIAIGATSIRCLQNGMWSSGSFRCMPLSCSNPNILNPRVRFSCSDAHRVGSQCELSCASGYKLVGQKKMICKPNQKWSVNPRQTSCSVSRECASPYVPKGATISCIHEFNIGSLCTIRCPPKTFLRGRNSQILACMDNRRWNEDFDGEQCISAPRCEQIQLLYPDAPWDKLQVVCTGENLLGSVCKIDCGEHGEQSITTACTSNSIGMPTWSRPPPSRCNDIITKPCDLEMDLSNGKVKYSDESPKDLVRVLVATNAPFWSRALSNGVGTCDYQSVVQIQYKKMNAFALKMRYAIPSGRHLHISSTLTPANKGKSIWAKNFHLNGIPGFNGRGLIPSKSNILFVAKKSNKDIVYKVDDTKEVNLAVDFTSEDSVYIGLNRAIDLAHYYDIGKMGSGLCKFCLSFSEA